MHQSRPFALLGLIIIAALGLAACTDSSPTIVGPDGGARQIAVSGRGEASADPDTVLLSLGVSVLRDSVSIAVAAPTPVAPGQTTVSVSVSIVFELE